jgi:hypothetical protein
MTMQPKQMGMGLQDVSELELRVLLLLIRRVISAAAAASADEGDGRVSLLSRLALPRLLVRRAADMLQIDIRRGRARKLSVPVPVPVPAAALHIIHGLAQRGDRLALRPACRRLRTGRC